MFNDLRAATDAFFCVRLQRMVELRRVCRTYLEFQLRVFKRKEEDLGGRNELAGQL
jgi:hypothetical protein